jgi:[ribosomal protein S5]-alanine N-acetyltransferase
VQALASFTGAFAVVTKKTFAVSIDEIKQNIVFGDVFSESYQRSLTMSDGQVRNIALRPMMKDGELVVQLKDGEHVSYMGPNGCATHGTLMIRLMDMGVLANDPMFADSLTMDTQRLRLRPLRMDDAEDFFEIWSDNEAMRYFSFQPMHSIAQAEERIASKLQFSADRRDLICVVELQSTGEVVGDCALFNGVAHSQRAEIGFCLKRKHWGNGYMVEATAALIAHGFEQVGLRRLEADVDPRNQSSINLLERLGFKREGFLRERWMINGEAMDTVLYGLLRGEESLNAFPKT